MADNVIKSSICLMNCRLWENTAAQTVLKTDDDCFVNIDAILSLLPRVKGGQANIWWSRCVWYNLLLL